MSWWGKLFGGAFGFMVGGPIGALLGAALGHGFDHGLDGLERDPPDGSEAEPRERAQAAFFSATFLVMGHIAKADGTVSPAEIRLADELMRQMQLDDGMRRAARELFRQGKASDFPLDDVLDQLRRECHRSRNLIRVFLEIQIQAVHADGEAHPAERETLARVATRLGFSQAELDDLEAMFLAEMHHASGGRRGMVDPPPFALDDAYAVLGVTPDADDAEVKRAYRRLMSQHHPDKLVSKGLPEEMMQIATEQTREIRAAYERIRASRKVARK